MSRYASPLRTEQKRYSQGKESAHSKKKKTIRHFTCFITAIYRKMGQFKIQLFLCSPVSIGQFLYGEQVLSLDNHFVTGLQFGEADQLFIRSGSRK